ncbi:hypothetical protein BCR44DRAFT_1443113, partial [Catenaria anguillulae PL171]
NRKSCRYIARMPGKAHSTVSRWVKRWETDRLSGRIHQYPKNRKPTTWITRSFIDEACAAFEKRFGLTISQGHLWTILSEAGFSRKTLERRMDSHARSQQCPSNSLGHHRLQGPGSPMTMPSEPEKLQAVKAFKRVAAATPRIASLTLDLLRIGIRPVTSANIQHWLAHSGELSVNVLAHGTDIVSEADLRAVRQLGNVHNPPATDTAYSKLKAHYGWIYDCADNDIIFKFWARMIVQQPAQ